MRVDIWLKIGRGLLVETRFSRADSLLSFRTDDSLSITPRVWPSALRRKLPENARRISVRATAVSTATCGGQNRQQLPKSRRRRELRRPLFRCPRRKARLSAFSAAILTKKNNSDTQPPHAAGF